MRRKSNKGKGCLIAFVAFMVLTNVLGMLGRWLSQRGQETMALNDIRTIQAAAAQYQSQFGRYPASLDELGARGSLIQAELASGAKGGYRFTLQGGPAVYTLNANPATIIGGGRRTFYSDETKVVRANGGPEPAGATSSAVQ